MIKYDCFYMLQRTRKRIQDKLVSAETVDGGKLREAATRKEDQRILVHILDKDCIALEVKYHQKCYKNYTSFLFNAPQKEPAADDYASGKCSYKKSFDGLCKFVEHEIIESHGIYYLSMLKAKFVKMVPEVENDDASSYRTSRLKKRLQERFPQLVFHTPSVRSRSEIVYAEELCKGDAAEIILNTKEISDVDETEDEAEDSEENHNNPVMEVPSRMPLRDYYMIALELREHIRDYASPWYKDWPPLASDITGDSVKKVVSPLLFNFMAWILGYSDDPEDSQYVNMDENHNVKLFSICQDIVYNSSKGKTQTPKSLALSIAVRQISGCSSLINVLNGLGHSVSLSSTMAYDTALAQVNIDTSTIIPREFVPNEAVNLVFDNIDFGEEIKKQTHVTNGIITQKATSAYEPTVRPQKGATIKKTQRSVKAPHSIITPFSIGKKETPKFHKGSGTTATNASAKMAERPDLAYVLVKLIKPDQDELILPLWTGFNTLLYRDDTPDVSRVGYLPVIDGSPTQYSTINAILKNSTEIADKLNLR